MTKIIEIAGLTCRCSLPVRTDRIAYILYPMDALADWIEPAAKKYDITLVQITGMDWQNVFSPWAAKGVSAGTADFKGESPQFLNLIEKTLIPKLDEALGMNQTVERTLTGVSMSGLFALWQWPQTSLFRNILCLSGSFWYEGFMDWFKKQDYSDKKGFAFFLLGRQEPKSSVAAFKTVGVNTETIIRDLEEAGVNVDFRWVVGNHYQHGIERLDLAMTALAENR